MNTQFSTKALCAITLLSFTSAAHAAVFIGNSLVQRDSDTDTADYTLSVFKSSPMPSDGYVDGLAIYQQASGYTFTLRLLHYTGVGQIYNQYYVSPAFGTYSDPSDPQVRFYWDYANVNHINVQQGDLFAIYGKGIPFSTTASTDELYYDGSDFAGNGTIDLAAAPLFPTQRIYSAALTFTATADPVPTDPVPEPASLLLLAAPLALCLRRRSR